MKSIVAASAELVFVHNYLHMCGVSVGTGGDSSSPQGTHAIVAEINTEHKNTAFQASTIGVGKRTAIKVNH